MKLEVGQTVFIVPRRDALRRNENTQESTITKIGRKYFEVEGFGRFGIGTMHEAGMWNYEAFLSVQDISEDVERMRLERLIREYFRQSQKQLTLADARQIAEILNIKL